MHGRVCAGKTKRDWRKPILWLPVFLWAISMLGTAVGNGAAPDSGKLEKPHLTLQGQRGAQRVLSVLESRMNGQKITAKAKEKLFSLAERQPRLLNSLAEVLAADSQTAGADIAFLLITVLIILS